MKQVHKRYMPIHLIAKAMSTKSTENFTKTLGELVTPSLHSNQFSHSNPFHKNKFQIYILITIYWIYGRSVTSILRLAIHQLVWFSMMCDLTFGLGAPLYRFD